jgi:hypothetical protein
MSLILRKNWENSSLLVTCKNLESLVSATVRRWSKRSIANGIEFAPWHTQQQNPDPDSRPQSL